MMKKVNPEAQTLLDLRVPEEITNMSGSREKISTSSALALDPKPGLTEKRSATRGKILLFLAAFGMGAGTGIAGTYEHMKRPGLQHAAPLGQPDLSAKKNPVPVVPESIPAQIQERGADDLTFPDTSEKLRQAIKSTNAKVRLEDFNHSNKFVNVLVLVSESDGETKGFKWVPISRDNLKDDDLLIAIKIEKPEYKYLLKFVARQPVSTVEDEDEPSVIYAYYRCVNSDNKENRGGSIAVVDPVSVQGAPGSKRKRPTQYLTTYGFILPKCDKK